MQYMLDTNNKKIIKTIITYLILTLLCYIFSVIYLSLSFGVISFYMKYLAVIPLIGEAIFGIIYLLKIKVPRVSYNLFNASVFTLTVGSAIQGILEICGSSSKFVCIFLVISLIELMISAINLIISLKKKNKKSKTKTDKI